MQFPVTNFGKVTVDGLYSSAATTVDLETGHGSRLPSTFPFPLVWWNADDYQDPADDPNKEIVSVTNRSGDTLTVARGQEGTSAVAHDTSGKTYKMVLGITKKMYDEIFVSMGLLPKLLHQDNVVNEIANTVTESDLVSVSVPAGTISHTNKRALRLTLIGTLLNNSGGGVTFTFRVYWGGALHLTFDAHGSIGSSASSREFRVEVLLSPTDTEDFQTLQGLCRIGDALTTGTDYLKGSTHEAHATRVNANINTDLNQDFDVTIEMGTAHANAHVRHFYSTIEVL